MKVLNAYTTDQQWMICRSEADANRFYANLQMSYKNAMGKGEKYVSTI